MRNDCSVVLIWRARLSSDLRIGELLPLAEVGTALVCVVQQGAYGYTIGPLWRALTAPKKIPQLWLWICILCGQGRFHKDVLAVRHPAASDRERYFEILL